MLTNSYHIQYFYCTIVIDIFSYPIRGELFDQMLTSSNRIKTIDKPIRNLEVDISISPCFDGIGRTYQTSAQRTLTGKVSILFLSAQGNTTPCHIRRYAFLF
jgi:hypothetical protein